MRNIHLKIFIFIIAVFIIFFIIFSKRYEGFTPKINSLYRPYLRNVNQMYESFVNNYGPNVIITKLRKWNIY